MQPNETSSSKSARFRRPDLPDHAVLEVGDARSLEHPDLFELDVAEVVERPFARPDS